MIAVVDVAAVPSPFRHEAFLYEGDDEYLTGTVPFIEEGLRDGDSVLVAVPSPRLGMLQRHFAGCEPGRVRFAAMEELGRNPGWIIPAWAEFVGPHAAAGRTVRGIGEPIWPGRGPDELVECERHESLLNIAFRNAAGFRLMCPYDLATLDVTVLEEAERNHPHIGRPGQWGPSGSFRADIPPLLSTPLPPVPAGAEVVDFGFASVAAARRKVAGAAAAAGVPPGKLDDLVLAVSEALTNSISHGGGGGRLASWSDGQRFVCEVRDRGLITDPLAGRLRPPVDHPAGRGMWLMHQLCDLVQIRQLCDGQGQVIRLHVLL